MEHWHSLCDYVILVFQHSISDLTLLLHLLWLLFQYNNIFRTRHLHLRDCYCMVLFNTMCKMLSMKFTYAFLYRPVLNIIKFTIHHVVLIFAVCIHIKKISILSWILKCVIQHNYFPQISSWYSACTINFSFSIVIYLY